jgi:WD40 repeat protein
MAEFSPDGKRVITSSDDGTARVWDAETGSPLTEPVKLARKVLSARFSPDGNRIATTAVDGTIGLWDARLRRLLPVIPPAPDVWQAEIGPEGGRVVMETGDGAVQVWDSRIGGAPTVITRRGGENIPASFSPDGGLLGTVSSDNAARVWDVSTGRLVAGPLSHSDRISMLAFSPDGKSLATASWDHSARVWEARTGHPVTDPLSEAGQIDSVAFSPDGQRLLTGSHNLVAQIWAIRTGERLGRPLRHEFPVVDAGFSPDGRRVVTACADGTARVWDAETSLPLTGPIRHNGAVVDARFSPDGTKVLTVCDDGTARIWDARTGRPLSEEIPPASLAKAGNYLGVTQFSADGQRIVSTSKDYAMRLWDVQTRQLLARPLEGERGFHVAKFSPDGRRLVAFLQHSAARIWDLPPAAGPAPKWLATLAECVSGRKLNQQNLVEETGLDRVATLEKLRDELRAAPDSDWVAWGRWFLADPSARPISPYSKIMAREHIEDCVKARASRELKEAEGLAPDNREFLARISEARLELSRAAGEAAAPPAGHQTDPANQPAGAGNGAITPPTRVVPLVYGDALGEGWTEWSWADVQLTNAAPVHAGSCSISVRAGPWQGLLLHHDAFEPSQFDRLSFWVHGGDSPKQLIVSGCVNGAFQNAVMLTVPGGIWTHVVEPLSSLDVVGQPNFDGICLQEGAGAEQGVFYVDEIELLPSISAPVAAPK